MKWYIQKFLWKLCLTKSFACIHVTLKIINYTKETKLIMVLCKFSLKPMIFADKKMHEKCKVLTKEPSLIGKTIAWSSWAWKGIKAEPTSFNNNMNWSFLEAAEGYEECLSNRWAFIRLRIFCHLRAALLPIFVNISSGMGTSKTVSRPSSLSRFGHNFLIEFTMYLGCL